MTTVTGMELGSKIAEALDLGEDITEIHISATIKGMGEITVKRFIRDDEMKTIESILSEYQLKPKD